MIKTLSFFLLFLGYSYSFHLIRTNARISATTLHDMIPRNPKADFIRTSKGLVDGMIKLAVPILLSSAANAVEVDSRPIVVLGSSGKTGRLIVEKLASDGFPVRPTFRGDPRPEVYNGLSNIINPLTADVTKIDTLEGAIKDARCVIFAASASSKGGNAKDVDYIGVENVAKECIRLKVPRLVVISSGAITRPNSLGYKFTNIFGNIMDFKIRGENSLRDLYVSSADDKLSYVIIRPGGLLDGAAVGASKVTLNQGDSISGEVNRADVAACAAKAAISNSIPSRVTLEMYETGKSGPLEGRFPQLSGYEVTGTDYEDMFQKLSRTAVNIP